MYSVKGSFCYTCANYNFIRPRNHYLRITICPNWTSLLALSVREDTNTYEVIMNPDREQSSALIELIFVYSKFDSDERLR